MHVIEVQQDGACAVVAAQVVKPVGGIGIGAAPQRNNRRKSDAVRLRPVQHGGSHAPALRHQRQLSVGRHGGGHPRIQVHAGHLHTQRVIAHDAQQMATRHFQHGSGLRRCEAIGQHHGGTGATVTQLPDHPADRISRGAYHREIGRSGQIGHPLVHSVVVQHGVFEIDGPQLAGKPGRRQVAPRPMTQGIGARTGPDDRHRSRLQKSVQVP